jgi:ribonucleoside-diphosphate reductase beta chain
LRNKLSSKDVYNIIEEGVEICKFFYEDALPVRLIGINESSMMDYIMYVSDRLLIELGYEKKYNKPNPFAFMETIGMQSKTNFFESRPTEYQSAHVLGDKDNKNDIIEDDF